MTRATSGAVVTVRAGALAAAALLALVACARSGPAETPADKPGASTGKTRASEPTKSEEREAQAPAGKAGEPPVVVLSSEQVRAIGLVTTALAAMEHRDEVVGFGAVLAHDTIAQP